MTGDSSSFGRWFFYTEARLLVLIFVCLSAGIVTTGYFYYRAYEKHYRSDIERQLSSIADLKVGDLVQWRKERLDDANMLFRNPAFSSLMRREEQGDTEARRQLQTWVEKFQTANGYASASLIDAEGVTRTLSPTDPAPLSSTLSRRLPEVLRSGQFAFQDFYRDEHDKRIYLAMLIPILNESDGSHPLGVVVLRIDPATYLYPLIQRWPTPSSTAETLLVRREGNEVAFLNELRFQKNTALTLRAPLDRIMLPAAQAALGKEGIMDGIDYRGVQVVAILRSIPDSPWSLVTRIDAAEVYAPMREQLRMIAGLMGALLLSAGACVGLIWRQQRVRFFQARYEAQEDRAKLAAIVEFAEDAIIGKSLDGTITSWNPGAERLFGYQAAEMIGQPVTRIIPQDDQAHEAESLKRLQRGEAIVSYEGVRIAKDGRPIEVSLTVSPIRDSAGAIIRTGKPIRSFGANGAVDLRDGLDRDPRTLTLVQSTTPGRVLEDKLIIGSATNQGYGSAPGDIRAFDVRSGKLVWTFHTVPRPGEFGYETWPKDAWRTVGGANVWSEFALDEKHGVIYAPTASAKYNFYGADRHGDNLFADCLLALDARTGRRIWHFQMVHHDVFDY